MERLPGIVQWFSFEDRASVTAAVTTLTDLRITRLRTLFSWADWERPGGPEWFDWFIAELTRVPGLDILPALFYTPLNRAQKDGEGNQRTSYPPEDPAGFADFTRTMIERYGTHFSWIQLWNEPNWEPYWSTRMDPDGALFAQMAIPAADLAHERGKRVSLGGTTPLDYPWFTRMDELGLLRRCDAVAFHYSPSWRAQHRRWHPLETEIATFRALLTGLGHSCEVWFDEAGFATRTAHDTDETRLAREQVAYFDLVRNLDADRIYWYALYDQPEHIPTDDELNAGTERDPTAYHFGMIRADGTEKPLYRHWKSLAM